MVLNRLLIVLFTVIGAVGNVLAAQSEDNVYIAERSVTCRLDAREDKVTGAIITQTYRMGVRRTHDTGVVMTFYDKNSTVDHASGTGGKPSYRAWEDSDIFYSGTRVCLLPIEIKPGKLSKADIRVSYPSPEFLDDIFLTSSIYDIAKESVVVEIPAKVAERVTVDVLNPTGRERTVRSVDDKGNVTVTVSMDNVKAFRGESMMPHSSICIPRVRVNAAFSDLDEMYRYLRAKLENVDSPQGDVADLASRLAAEAGSDTLARIDAVAAWVRGNIRYVAIEHGELAFKPTPAAEVLANRYGDCKGSANLICALLRAMGIDGRRVWIGTKGHVAAPLSESPNLGSVNHMIAAAIVGDSTVFIDGTVEFAPRGFVPTAIAGQECLIENGDSCILTRVCGPSPAQSVLMQSGSMEIDGNCLRGEIRYDLTGAWRCMIESTVSGINATRRPQLLSSFLSMGRKSVVAENADLEPCKIYDAGSSTITAAIGDSEGVKAVSGRSRLYVMPRLLRMAPVETVNGHNRRWPIVCDDFLPVDADIVIAIPENYVADGLPRSTIIDNPWFEGHVTYRPEGDRSVRCTASLRQRKEYAGANEAAAWNEAVKEVENASSSALVLLRTSAE